MTGSSEFNPGRRLPTLGMAFRPANSWVRWVLPIVAGLLGALISSIV
jgi:hypothetical protein